ncbi:uncharacterized protein LAESUDRAFT_729981 [Laetiporus sulphureus 93-53]|uniref:BZIP domain-containing protein n=1 Tax=Laetiporus sulphureus 93-53 TaxID=1314785 RepID=A0A165CFT8_9APHY|nr:uncharacterized protein LAESUDRAFT_729981 [Laetiporus sulphureus 93-53]KZT02734.1 hypothetical protein LAESUDRAFT_729981 [Laetiporus sulphureus 93-53]
MSPSPSAQSKASSDDNASKMSEAALRKKKNADAQAAFRARRANYIATLEETVTNLESVVIQLQDSCSEVKEENAKLRQEVARWKQEARQRDRMLKTLWQERGAANLSSQSHDYPPAPPYSAHPSPSVITSPMSTTHVGQYMDNGVRYPAQPVSLGGAFQHPSMGSGQDYSQRSPTVTMASNVGAETSPDNRAHHLDAQRMSRYEQYSYPPANTTSDGAWMQPEAQAGLSPEVFDGSSSSHSPNYLESPTLTSSELAYSTQYGLDDQKASSSLTSFDSSSYPPPPSRSISPAASTPTSTSSTTSLAPAPFSFTFQDSSLVQDHSELGYRRQPQLTLHGGTADISMITSSRDAARYRPNGRSNPLTDRPIAQALASYSRRENGSGGRESDDSESYAYSSRSRTRSEAPSTHVSRSPSPAPPICGTLAVIKAQAFGALRRTRNRSRKTSEGAAKAAVEALEARGIGMGVAIGSKRPRLHIDDDDDVHN